MLHVCSENFSLSLLCWWGSMRKLIYENLFSRWLSVPHRHIYVKYRLKRFGWSNHVSCAFLKTNFYIFSASHHEYITFFWGCLCALRAWDWQEPPINCSYIKSSSSIQLLQSFNMRCMKPHISSTQWIIEMLPLTLFWRSATGLSMDCNPPREKHVNTYISH